MSSLKVCHFMIMADLGPSSDKISVGSAVKHLKVGQRVAMEPGATCRVCDACKSGQYEVYFLKHSVNPGAHVHD